VSTDVLSLQQRVEQAGRDLDGAPALEIVRWAVENLDGPIAVAGSMQDAVLPHLVSQVVPGVDVLFLETGYHFAETLKTRDVVARDLDVNIVEVTPRQTVAEQDAEYGPKLFSRDPGLCCFLRKVAPLAEALEPYAGWVTGVRREEAPTRANTPVIGWDENHQMVKVNPIATWTAADVEAYQVEHGLPRNPLTLQGYPSIGCEPCTAKVAPGADPRSGRWAGRDKIECGIHV
jgi:phosphoadenosine phosphosulfate reductase